MIKDEYFEQAKNNFLLGLEMLELKRYEEAEKYFSLSLTIIPDRLSTLTNLAATLIALKKFTAAEAIIHKSINLFPNDELIHFINGNLMQEKSRWLDAIACYDKAISHKADYAAAYINRGLSLFNLNRFEEAFSSYDKSIHLERDNAEAYYYRGNTLQKLNRVEEALKSYEQAIKLGLNSTEVFYNRGKVLAELGRLDDALTSYSKAVTIDVNFAEALCACGNVLQDLDRHNEALTSYNQAIKVNANFWAAYVNRGISLQELSRFDEALISHDRAITINPDNAHAFYNRGIVLQELKRYEDALKSYNQALMINADYVEAFYNRGNALQELKRYDEALNSYDQAINITPDYAEAYCNRGNTLQELNQFSEALKSYSKAIMIKPDYAKAFYNHGNALKKLGRLAEALTSFDQAINFKPDYSEAHSNRGLALQDLKRPEEALASHDRAIAIKPDYAEAYTNRGLALQDLKQLDQAVASHNLAIAIKPDYADAYWNKSIALLLGGDFKEGWELHEWRWKKQGAAQRLTIPLKEWDGNAIKNGLLVLAEQGLGDEVFYLGMLRDLECRASPITVAVDKRLIQLLQRSFVHCRFIPNDPSAIYKEIKTDSNLTAHVSMGSLGRYFRRSPQDFATINLEYLKACSTQQQALRQKLEHNGRLICGISWCSKNKDIGEYKSLTLMDLAPIFSLQNYRFVNLQYGDTAEEQAILKKKMDVSLTQVPEVDNFNDIDGLAALIGACDVIVTVSNTTAHLAAALGKPVLIILPSGPGLLYYWHVGRDDSPWYPSAKLYRQTTIGDWSSVISRVAVDLLKVAY